MSNLKVHLDPGHYGSKYNRSTTNYSYYESNMTWNLANYLKAELESRGAVVTLSRTSKDSDPALYDRGYGAKGCQLFLSLHSNACGTESVDYPIVYRGYDKTEAEDFAMKLSKAVQKLMGTRQAAKTATRKGSSGGEYYGVLRGARAAGLTYYYIIEHSFHTNAAATEWLLQDANIRALAKMEAEFIVSYFGSKSAPAQKPETSTSGTTAGTYTVVKGDTLSQIGAKLGVKWQDIAAANGIKSPYTIYTGQKLVIPGVSGSSAASQPSAPATTTYTVKKGDTLSQIGAALGVKWQDIATANNIKSPYIIFVNQKLTIPNK